jgi:hypothetical protein
MLKLADCQCRPGVTLAENIKRTERFNVVMAGVDPSTSVLMHQIKPEIKVMAYVRPHSSESWTEYVEEVGYGDYVIQYDGIVLDTPFEHPSGAMEGVRDCANIAEACGHSAPIIPNFGDFGTWTSKSPAKPEYMYAARALAQIAPWHFVQVAYQMQYHNRDRWIDLRYQAMTRLAAGKTLVLGIHDPLGSRVELACLLMHSFQHERLYWYYQTSGDVSMDNQWNGCCELER